MKYIIPLLLTLLILPTSFAASVVVNSQDWRDVLTGANLAALNDHEIYFATDPNQATDLSLRLGADQEVILITGRQQAGPGLRSLIQNNGYTITEEINSRDALDTNIDLALDSEATNLVIVDDAYGFNALAVATYANVRNANILFASPDVIDVIEAKNPDEILLYGHIPRDIVDLLEPYNPIIINEQDKFEDNFLLVQRFQEVSPKESVLLTNGEFLEAQIMTDDKPVLFTGRQNVPDEIIDFLRDQEFRVAVMIGNSLAPNARYIKDAAGISVLIKFAQGRNEQQFALDLFDLPTPNPLITLTSVEYDPVAGQLRATLQNPGEVATFFTASFTTAEGTVEDAAPVFLEAGSYKTQLYESGEPGETADYTILYGAFPTGLELLLRGQADIERVTIDDKSEIAITEAFYDVGKESFFITVENTGPVDTYVLLEAVDVRIGNERLRIAAPVERIKSESAATIQIEAALTDSDIDRNRALELEAFYGQREFSLVKRMRATLSFDVKAPGLPLYFYIIIVVVAILLIWFAVGRKRDRY